MEALKAAWADPYRRALIIGVTVLVLLANVPFVVGGLKERHIRTDGVIGNATVTELRTVGEGEDEEFWLDYRLPDEYGDRTEHSVRVSEPVWKRADLRDTIRVQVLAEDPEEHKVEGAEEGHVVGLTTIVVDLLILGGFAYMMYSRRPRRETSPVRSST
ncbi:MAG: hypothetical protein ACI379_04990 [Nocardioides sp.]|uniref:hypothetical protein n=1 Tax=Nocardioides sp. TaxID=35761 RepID=UPI003F0F40EC